MDTLEERIRELMQDLDWSVSDVAKRAGVSGSAVSQWLGKGSKRINSISLLPALLLERESGYSALWLSKGEGPKKVPGRATPQAVEWPFRFISQEAYAALDPEERAVAQKSMADEIARLSVQSGKRRSA